MVKEEKVFNDDPGEPLFDDDGYQ